MYAALDVHGGVEHDFAWRSPVGAESSPQRNGYRTRTGRICDARRRSPGYVFGLGRSLTIRIRLSRPFQPLTLLSRPLPVFQISLSLVGLSGLLWIPLSGGMVWRHELQRVGLVLLVSRRVESRICLPSARQLERVDCLRAAAGD